MTNTAESAPITKAFEAHEIDNSAFHHAEHVRVAFDLLRKYDFIDAASVYAKRIQTLAARAGAPKKFNLTVTYAFMSLIAERLAASQSSEYDSFVASNPDLMKKDVLKNWYSTERIDADLARSIFLMPDTGNQLRNAGSRS